MRNFRVAMVAACPFPAPRGTPIRIYRLAETLARRGHAIDIFTYHIGEPANGEPFGIHRIIRVPTYHRQAPGPTLQKLLIVDPLLMAMLTWSVRSSRYDIVHAHHYEGLLTSLPVKTLFRIPVVFDAHTLLASELPSYSKGFAKRLMSSIGRYLDRQLPARSDHVIAVSEEIRTSLLEKAGLSEDDISLIPNGVEDFFFGSPKSARRTGSSSDPRLVYAGNLATYQDIDLLLHVFAAVRRVKPGLRLQLLTGSPLKQHENVARALGIYDFIDVVNPDIEQLPGMLAGATVAANTRSECSGMPQKLLNYMAAGCPVVTCAGSAKNISDGETGLVVPNGDVAAFRDAILRLLDDEALATRLGQNAQNYVRENMSWEHAARSIEVVYDRLTLNSRKSR
jgi:glycosyltransferase involved in cell wall biosynthesis